MGHYCRICQRIRPNEAFSGRGHRTHVCKKCQRQPRAWREQIEQLDELDGFLDQSHISTKNVHRIELLCQSGNETVQRRASVMLKIARLYPYKRRRYVRLAKENRPLLDELKNELGDGWWDNLCCSGFFGPMLPSVDELFSPTAEEPF